MVLFDERPPFEKAWLATSFRVVMAGMGDDTVMLIAEMYKRGYEPDEIIFCDTGSEFEHTYNFRRIIIFVTNSGQTQQQRECAAEKQ